MNFRGSHRSFCTWQSFMLENSRADAQTLRLKVPVGIIWQSDHMFEKKNSITFSRGHHEHRPFHFHAWSARASNELITPFLVTEQLSWKYVSDGLSAIARTGKFFMSRLVERAAPLHYGSCQNDEKVKRQVRSLSMSESIHFCMYFTISEASRLVWQHRKPKTLH